MSKEDYGFIEAQIGYDFKNRDLLHQAFVRRSYSKENGGGDNEVLEFIGDKVLDFIVVKLLVEKFGYFSSECDDYDKNEDLNEFFSEYQENKLTELKKHLTERKTLAKCMDDLDLANLLIMGRGDQKNNVQNELSVKEDLFEAILGAVALDCNWDIAELKSVVCYMLQPENILSVPDENYVALIQEWSLRHGDELPDIYTTNSSYYDEQSLLWYGNEIRSTPPRNEGMMVINVQEYPKTHFVSRMTLPGVDKRFVGYGRSKNESRKDVCKLAYEFLEKNDMLYTIRDEIENPSRDMAINQLEILSRRGYFSIPTYEFFEEHDKNGNPVWKCECHIEEEEYYFDYTSSAKKDAKKGAAYDMLLYVLDMEDEDDE